MVVAQMGYEGSYLEFLLDLRPEWNFSCEDVVMAFVNQDAYLAKKKETVYSKN